MTVKDGADLGAAERQTEVAGGALVDGVNGEAAGLVSSESEDFGLEFHAWEIIGEKGQADGFPWRRESPKSSAYGKIF
jgi:hypothetical protein